MKTSFSPGWLLFGTALVIFMLAPLVLVVLLSFGNNAHATFPLGVPTLGWYKALFAKPDFYVAATNSLVITGWVGGLSLVIGTAAAFSIAEFKSRTTDTGLVLLILPLMLPPLVLALALATTFSALDIRLGFVTVILSQLVFTQPFVILIMHARMRAFPIQLLESARDLGAGPVRAFFNITLPIIRSSLIGAALIAMALSLDDFIITYFTIGGGLTLPTLTWGMLRTSFNPSINALASIILIVTVGFTVVALRLSKYRG
ncbi:ABC transporter permease subunit [Mesorhizobium sp. B2-6-1]|uniref:ABC transporter permease n=1 Tax=Mesorhizobium sp. B2-6-1 TaxID=2589916 RepID=UPI00112B31EF|nr:ABC transporter permease subunit [Mesorhizobium sp. B2-6-1]TPJ66644.1 ABC transporter permease subunit [Mesorhizobium sp. B2-6-1]